MREIAPLTGVRGIAAVWVVLCHYSGNLQKIFETPPPLHFLISNGWTAVELFFVLSGFIMMHAHPAGAQTKPEYFAFLWRRWARIWPVHFVLLLLFSFYIGAQGWGYGPYTFDFIRYITLTHVWWNYSHAIWNDPSWSLSAEWGAYLLFPAIYAYVSRLKDYREVLHAGAWGLFAYLAIMVTFSNQMGQVIQCGLLRSVPCFLFGALIYRFKQLYHAPPSRHFADICALAVPAIALLLYFVGFNGWLLLPVFVLLLYGLSFEQGAVARLLATPALLFLGRISFSIYMVHYAIMILGWTHLPPKEFVGAPVWHAIGVFGAHFGCIMLAAWTLHTLIENPSRVWMLKRSISRRRG